MSDKLKEKALDVCKELEAWWRLPSNMRTIEKIEPIISKALEVNEESEGV